MNGRRVTPEELHDWRRNAHVTDRSIGWHELALLLVFIAACIVAAPLLMEWSAGWQPRPAACAGLSAAECSALAQEGGL